MKELALGETVMIQGREYVLVTIDTRTTADVYSATVHFYDPLTAARSAAEERQRRQSLENQERVAAAIPALVNTCARRTTDDPAIRDPSSAERSGDA